MEVMVTTGAVSLATTTNKPKSSFCRPDALPVAQPTVSKHWRENITFHELAYPKLTWGLPTLSLTTNSSWLPWRRVAMPLISPLCGHSPLVAKWLQYLLGRTGVQILVWASVKSRYVIGLISWVDMAHSSLFVLRAPLNTNQPTRSLLQRWTAHQPHTPPVFLLWDAGSTILSSTGHCGLQRSPAMREAFQCTPSECDPPLDFLTYLDTVTELLLLNNNNDLINWLRMNIFCKFDPVVFSVLYYAACTSYNSFLNCECYYATVLWYY